MTPIEIYYLIIGHFKKAYPVSSFKQWRTSDESINQSSLTRRSSLLRSTLALASCVVATFLLSSATADCWSVISRNCCSLYVTGSDCTNGSYCPGIIEIDEQADYINVTESGWNLSSHSSISNQRCEYYLGLCDTTKVPVECTVSDYLVIHSECTDYNDPAIPENCNPL